MDIVVDVRSQHEFVKNHIKGAINIPIMHLEMYESFLKGMCNERKLKLYCNTEFRAEIAREKLNKMGVEAEIIPQDELKNYEWEGKDVICAMNFVVVRPGHEKEFEERVKELCKKTERYPGFLGSQLLRVDGVSAIGSGLPGEMRNMEMNPGKYVILTYWESKEIHDRSHLEEDFKKAFMTMPAHLVQMPYEEFYEILR